MCVCLNEHPSLQREESAGSFPAVSAPEATPLWLREPAACLLTRLPASPHTPHNRLSV